MSLKGGRPPLLRYGMPGATTTSFVLHQVDRAALDQIAAAREVTLGSVLREAVAEYLKREACEAIVAEKSSQRVRCPSSPAPTRPTR